MDLNSKPLYQLWSEENFSADIDVQVMTRLQEWMYRTLLQKAFVYKTRPDLPTDDNTLWKLARCESLQQWQENKEPVIEMFQHDTVDGQEVLYRKRLRDDWLKLVDRRASLSDAGKRGADRRWGNGEMADGWPPRGYPLASDAKGSKEVREVSEEERPTAKVTAKELNAFKLIPKSCRELLGVRPEREEWYKPDLKELVETYGGTQVVGAFETWAGQQTTTPRNPVKDFIKVADGFLQNRVKTEAPELNALCVSLYHIGNQTFTGKHRQLLNNLLAEFSFQEIERAYKEFISIKDDYDMKFAVRDFCEGGGSTIILASRQREEQERRTMETIQAETEQAQLDVQQTLNKLHEDEQAEEEL